MRTLIWSNTFIRAVKRIKKRRPDLLNDVENTLRLLIKDLLTHEEVY
jgi:mRNA-degrading endonuclease YafQ of YafQ-DinJ toxin-antitoxin module